MTIRLATAALALLAMVQAASSRGLDVSGQTIAAAIPSETILAAYIQASQTGRNENAEFEAWYEAMGDHSRGVDLADWRLSRSRFANVLMPKANLTRADLRGAVFDFSRIPGANLSSVKASGASFRYVDFGIKVADANFSGASLDGADFSSANLQSAIFNKIDKSDTELLKEDCPIPLVTLRDVNFSNADLRGAYLDGVDFTSENLNIKGANLEGAYLRCARFYCSDQRPGINLQKAHLKWANFVGATFSESPMADTLQEQWRTACKVKESDAEAAAPAQSTKPSGDSANQGSN